MPTLAELLSGNQTFEVPKHKSALTEALSHVSS
jgi:hypothetical protein